MFRPAKSSLAVFIVLAMVSFTGCHPKQRQKPVAVRIFRDLNSPYARELDHRILEFQQTNPHVSSGAPITLETYQAGQYATFLQQHLNQDITTEVVILNSAQDASANPAVQAELGHAVNICAAVRACPAEVPAFIPSSVAGASAEAGQQLLSFLQRPPT
jgi:hypothetical protein